MTESMLALAIFIGLPIFCWICAIFLNKATDRRPDWVELLLLLVPSVNVTYVLFLIGTLIYEYMENNNIYINSQKFIDKVFFYKK